MERWIRFFLAWFFFMWGQFDVWWDNNALWSQFKDWWNKQSLHVKYWTLQAPNCTIMLISAIFSSSTVGIIIFITTHTLMYIGLAVYLLLGWKEQNKRWAEFDERQRIRDQEYEELKIRQAAEVAEKQREIDAYYAERKAEREERWKRQGT